MKKNNIDNYFDAKIIADALSNKIISNSEEDNIEIDKWLTENVYAKTTLKKLSEENNLIEIYHEFESIDKNHHENKNKLIFKAIKQQNRRKKKLVYKYLISSSSAAVAILLFVIYNPASTNIEKNKISSFPEDKPLLILSNGNNIDLLTTNDAIANEDAIVDTSTKNINYTRNGKENNLKSEILYHTIVVPKTFTYTITLADSTAVTLNANSELRYPTTFSGDTREVYLKGEAYFKVKKGKNPFIVRSSSAQIKVYGTEFNVDTYHENIIKTVLVSGSVGVRLDNNSIEQMITPSQMITVNTNTKESTIEHVDVNQYTAWLSGYFRFDGEKLEDIVAEFTRWYNIDFEFIHEEDKKIKLNISFEKTSSLKDILQTIKEVTNLNFMMEGGICKIK